MNGLRFLQVRLDSQMEFMDLGLNDTMELLGHCVFCKGKVEDTETGRSLSVGQHQQQDDLSKMESVSKPSLPVFNLVWPWLQKKWKKRGSNRENRRQALKTGEKGSEPPASGGPDGVRNALELVDLFKDVKLRFTELPTMCSTCSQKMVTLGNLLNKVSMPKRNKNGNLDELMDAVNHQVQDLRTTIMNSQQGGNQSIVGERFENSLKKSKVAQDLVEGTLKIMGELGYSSLRIQERDVRFLKQLNKAIGSKPSKRGKNRTGIKKEQGTTPTPVLACKTCGSQFPTRTSLQSHVVVHSTARPFLCDKCGFTYQRRGDLRTHLKSHESRGLNFKPRGGIPKKGHHKGYQKNKAAKKSTSGSGKAKATTEDKRNLPRLSFEFISAAIAATKMPVIVPPTRIQKKKKKNSSRPPFLPSVPKVNSIEECKVKGPVLENLLPHQCNFCGKTLSSNFRLREHKLIHTGEQPHKCPLCFKLFRQTYSLTTHLKRCHDVKRSDLKVDGPSNQGHKPDLAAIDCYTATKTEGPSKPKEDLERMNPE